MFIRLGKYPQDTSLALWLDRSQSYAGVCRGTARLCISAASFVACERHKLSIQLALELLSLREKAEGHSPQQRRLKKRLESLAMPKQSQQLVTGWNFSALLGIAVLVAGVLLSVFLTMSGRSIGTAGKQERFDAGVTNATERDFGLPQ